MRIQCIHKWARQVTGDGRVLYNCISCGHMVDWMAAREEHDRLQAQGERSPDRVGPEFPPFPYDDSAGWIETPLGPGKFVAYDPHSGRVLVEADFQYLVEYPGEDCYIPQRGA